MQFNLPPKVRLAIYIFNGLLSIVAIYLTDKGVIGQPEQIALNAFTIFTSGLAALNVGVKTKNQ